MVMGQHVNMVLNDFSIHWQPLEISWCCDPTGTQCPSSPEFSLTELTGFDSHTEACHLNGAHKTICTNFGQDKWQHKSVDIVIPTRKNNQAGNGKTFTIKGFYYQPFLDVIHAVFSKASSKLFHLIPFKKVGFLDEDKKISFHMLLKGLKVAVH